MPTSAPSDLPQPRGILPALADYLEVSVNQFRSCIDEITHTITLDEQKATVHLQYVKFDSTNGEPRFDVLANVLAKHVVRYTLASGTRNRIREHMDEPSEGDLAFRARDYFRKVADSGEVGELLLFFLLEGAFQAPQVVCKMELKTNPRDEVKGADGIHVKWDPKDDHLDVFLGESKLYGRIGDALTDVFKSITEFHDLKRLDDELHLVTSHFKHVDTDLQDAITSFIDRSSTERGCHIIHACLIGFDWNRYRLLQTSQRDTFFKEFDQHYAKYAAAIQRMLNKRFAGCRHKHLSFTFLFLPFRDVMQFRHAFYKELLGVDIAPVDRNKKFSNPGDTTTD